MDTKIRNGNLVISLPLEEPRTSASGKTLVVASSRGVRRSTARLNGKIVCVVANAFVYPDAPVEGEKAGAKKRRKR